MYISVITPVHNSSDYIADTIDSVINQTHQNWEMILVDDFSSDNSVEIIQAYQGKDDKIRLIQSNTNVGAAEARNIALRQAKGDYIAFLDSDDIWLPNKLERQLQFMKSNNYAFSFTAYHRVNQSNTEIINRIGVPKYIGYKGFLRNTIIGTLTVMIDKRQTGYFEMPNIRSSHDIALWCDLLKRGFKAYGINEVLAYYRLVGDSNTAQKWKAAKDVWRVYRNIEKLSFPESVFNFCFYTFNALKKRIF